MLNVEGGVWVEPSSAAAEEKKLSLLAPTATF